MRYIHTKLFAVPLSKLISCIDKKFEDIKVQTAIVMLKHNKQHYTENLNWINTNPSKSRVISGATEWKATPAVLVAPVVLLIK